MSESKQVSGILRALPLFAGIIALAASTCVAAGFPWLPRISGKDGSRLPLTETLVGNIDPLELLLLVAGFFLITSTRVRLSGRFDANALVGVGVLTILRLPLLVIPDQTCYVFRPRGDECFALMDISQVLVSQIPTFVAILAVITMATIGRRRAWWIRTVIPVGSLVVALAVLSVVAPLA